LGQPDLATPPRISQAGIDGIVAGKTGYTSTAGEPELRAAIAARYPGVASERRSVVVTIGSQESGLHGRHDPRRCR
jgi:aspartate aminotransferase